MAEVLFSMGATAAVVSLCLANKTNDIAWVLASGFMFVGFVILILGERLGD